MKWMKIFCVKSWKYGPWEMSRVNGARGSCAIYRARPFYISFMDRLEHRSYVNFQYVVKYHLNVLSYHLDINANDHLNIF